MLWENSELLGDIQLWMGDYTSATVNYGHYLQSAGSRANPGIVKVINGFTAA
jgi:hypothetical protein